MFCILPVFCYTVVGTTHCYKQADGDDEGVIAGMIGGYTRARLQREGKLSDWAELPEPHGAKCV